MGGDPVDLRHRHPSPRKRGTLCLTATQQQAHRLARSGVICQDEATGPCTNALAFPSDIADDRVASPVTVRIFLNCPSRSEREKASVVPERPGRPFV